MLFLIILVLVLKTIASKNILLTFCGPFLSSVTSFCHIFSRIKRSSMSEHSLFKSNWITLLILVTHPCRQSCLQLSLAPVSRKFTLWIRQMFNPTVEIERVLREAVCQRTDPAPPISVIFIHSGFNQRLQPPLEKRLTAAEKVHWEISILSYQHFWMKKINKKIKQIKQITMAATCLLTSSPAVRLWGQGWMQTLL